MNGPVIGNAMMPDDRQAEAEAMGRRHMDEACAHLTAQHPEAAQTPFIRAFSAAQVIGAGFDDPAHAEEVAAAMGAAVGDLAPALGRRDSLLVALSRGFQVAFANREALLGEGETRQ